MWLVFNESGMSEREQELGRTEKGKELEDQDNFDRFRDHQQEDLVEDELDDNFWIKVKKVWNLLKDNCCG